MNDACQIKVLNGVEVQENGIVRNSKGRIIARLVDSVEFDSEHLEQTKPLKRLNKQEIARYMFSQNTGQDIGQMLIEYFCDKNGLTLEYIED